MEIFGIILALYVMGIMLPGALVGYIGEEVFGYDSVGGMFLWPLKLCALLLYGIYSLIRAVVRTFRNT
jgi:hypothetical protein